MRKSVFEKIMQGFEEARMFARTGKLKGGRVYIPPEIDAAAIRARTGLSRSAFAAQMGVSVTTLRDWEIGRRVPDGPAQVLLALLRKDPTIVRRTLKPAG